MVDCILYFDCDGVILNTMEEIYKMMDESGIDKSNTDEVEYFFVYVVEWNELIQKAGVINNAILKIRKIIDSHHFKSVKILTKLSGNETEELAKRRLFLKFFPEVEVITLPFKENKDEKVDATGNILVEDNIKNFERWVKAGGIGILFKKNECNYKRNIISDLSDIENTDGVKKLIKTRNIE